MKAPSRVKTQMEKSQREYYLNEQMKAIQKELGEIDDAPNDLDELARKIAEAGMPKQVEAKARAELGKLKQTLPSLWTLGQNQPVIPRVPFIR